MNKFDDFDISTGINIMLNDPLVKRVFKSKSYYEVKAYEIVSKHYSKIIKALTNEFKDIRDKLHYISKEKQVLIDELLKVLEKLENSQQNEENKQIIELCQRCINLFKNDIEYLNTKEMKVIPFDYNYCDWRYAYGLKEKN